MSSTTENLGSVREVTDNDDGMSQIGEIDGGFSDFKLAAYLERYGARGYTRLCEHLVYMSSQLRETWHTVRPKVEKEAVGFGEGSPR